MDPCLEAFAQAGASTPAALGESWRGEEQRLGKPLVVILDQAEEVFTRPAPDGSNELDDFVKALTRRRWRSGRNARGAS